jgi:hypothetical protein
MALPFEEPQQIKVQWSSPPSIQKSIPSGHMTTASEAEALGHFIKSGIGLKEEAGGGQAEKCEVCPGSQSLCGPSTKSSGNFIYSQRPKRGANDPLDGAVQ